MTQLAGRKFNRLRGKCGIGGQEIQPHEDRYGTAFGPP